MATFTVTEINDNVDGSLRDAIARANTRPGPDVIVFDSSLSSQTISLTGPRLNITGDLTMNGLGADRLTIDGNGNDIFGIQRSVANIPVTLTGVTLTDANDSIQVNGNANAVTLTDIRVADARVSIDPGTGEDITGDGLRVEGNYNRLTMRNSVFERNADNVDFAGPTTTNPKPSTGRKQYCRDCKQHFVRCQRRWIGGQRTQQHCHGAKQHRQWEWPPFRSGP